MVRRSIWLAVACVALGALLSACGGSSSSKKSPTARSSSAADAGTPSPDVRSGAAADVAAAIAPAMLQASDLPAGFDPQQSETKALTKSEVPGLSGGATGVFTTFTSAAGREYVTQIAVVPDNPADVAALADAVGSKQYIAGLTGGASDATATAIDAPGAPSGARAFSYSGTAATPTGPQVLNGEIVGFEHGKVFVVVLQAAYGDATHDVDVGAISGAIDARLAAIREAS